MIKQKNTFVNNFLYLLTKNQKKILLKLFLLMIIGLFFEIIGVGLLLPILSIFSDTNSINKYHIISRLIKILGNPSKQLLIIYLISFLILFYLIRGLFLIYLAWKQVLFTGNLYTYLSDYFFNGYVNLPYLFHTQNNSAPLIKNIQVEIDLLGSISQTSLIFLSEFFAAISLVVILFLIQPIGALTILIFFLFSSLLYAKFFKNKLSIWGNERMIHSERRSKYLMEGFGGIKDIKLFGVENYFIKAFNLHTNKYANNAIKSGTVSQIPRHYLEFLSVFALGISIFIIILTSEGQTDHVLPFLGIFIASAFRILPSVNRMISSIQSIRYLIPVVNTLSKEKNTIEKNSINVNTSGNKTVYNFNQNIKIENITFNYPGVSKAILNNVNMVISVGDFVGIVGESGSGKSTLVDILMGLYSPSFGSITVDNLNISEDPISWRKNIGYVPQSIYLVDDTIIQNVAFGINEKDINLMGVEEAIKKAQLNDFIESLPDKYNTKVGERGVRLSGGQKQRLGIARALYHNPKILIFDEATSALDEKTEENVIKSVLNLKNSYTIIMITHRLSTISNCDKLYSISSNELKLVKQ
jgi:ABC-type multidrug transport system fused ATPase/permease subunit